MRLPDAIGIGTRRSGSSWLHRVLNSHPDIGKPENGVHFFSEHLQDGAEWYGRQLAPHADRATLVEFSVSYLYPAYAAAAARHMADIVPEARLFVCEREPEERAFSDYLRSIRRQEIANDLTFEAAISAMPVLLDRGRYARLLRPYLEHFPADRLQVFFYDDLKDTPEVFVDGIARYFGVSAAFAKDAVSYANPKGKALRSPSLNAVVQGTKRAVDGAFARLGVADAWSNWKGRHVRTYERLIDLNHRERHLAAGTAARLRGQFTEDVDFLEALTGRDLSGWR